MAKIGKLGVVFRELRGSGKRPGEVISLRFQASDDKLYELDFHAGCAGITAHVLSQLGAEILPQTVQPLGITSAQGAHTQDGYPVIIFGLQGGGTLPLKMESGSVKDLIALLEPLASPPEEKRH